MSTRGGRATPPCRAGDDLRGRSARRPAEREGLVPVDVKVEFIRRLVAPGCRSSRPPASCTRLGAAARRRRRAGRPLLGDRRGRAAGARAQRARARPRAGEGVRHIAIFGSATETFAQKNLNRSLDEQFAMFEPIVAPGPRGRAGRPGLRLDVLRRPVGGRRPGRPGRRASASACSTSAPRSCRSATRSASARPATSAPCSTAFDAAGARRPTRSRCTSTTPTARRWRTRSPPCGTGSPLRRVGRRPRRLPLRRRARPATSPPRTWCGC